jgi:hypothetical protein
VLPFNFGLSSFLDARSLVRLCIHSLSTPAGTVYSELEQGQSAIIDVGEVAAITPLPTTRLQLSIPSTQQPTFVPIHFHNNHHSALGHRGLRT